MKTVCSAALCALAAAGLCAALDEGSFDRSLSVSGPVSLDVATDAGGIRVVPGTSGSVHVHAVIKSSKGWFDSGSDVDRRIHEIENNPPIEQNGNHLRIGYIHDHALLRNISIRYEIQTPRETNVKAHADSGGISVEGIQGPADCHTDSGGIDVRDIGGEVRATADSGGIRISNVKGGAFAHVDSGGIDASGIAGPIDVAADSGGIHLGQTAAAPIKAKADSGGISVRLASNAGYDLDLAAESGRISVGDPSVQGDHTSHRVSGKLRGGGPLVSIHVDSGNVSVD